MQPKNQEDSLYLFQARLEQIIDLKHPLCKLSHAINWSVFVTEFGPYYSETQGRPAKPIRLMVGLHYLKYAFNESDETVVERFLENPYWQYFCGFKYFEHELPLDPTTLVKWRKRVGPEKMEVLLKETIEVAKRNKILKKGACERVNVDTTVQEKAIAFPTDSGLYHKMRVKLVSAARGRDIKLRQSYTRKGKRALVKQSRYRHANQHKRANREVKRLKTYLGRVVRDIRRKAASIDPELNDLLVMADRLLAQERHSKNKLYSIHASEVECISKGKTHKRYEFGCKVGLVSTSRGNWIVGIKAFHGNPYDGHTLKESLEQAERISSVSLKHVHADKGYRGHNYTGQAEVHLAGSRGKKSRWERLWQRRRAAVEPVISHTKHDNRMIRNYLKGIEGDKINAILCSCGYNLRKLVRAFFWPDFLAAIFRVYQNFFVSYMIQNRRRALIWA